MRWIVFLQKIAPPSQVNRLMNPKSICCQVRHIYANMIHKNKNMKCLMILAGVLFIHMAFSEELVQKESAKWLAIDQDEIHDPAVTGTRIFKNPSEILSKLPHDGAGNQVNWVNALEQGYIMPYTGIREEGQPKLLDLDILKRNTDDMDLVLFPHRQHTEWLTCESCHEEIFKLKAGANKYGMFEILNGEYCGVCHGAVAFPLTECNRCHSVPRSSSQLQNKTGK